MGSRRNRNKPGFKKKEASKLTRFIVLLFGLPFFIFGALALWSSGIKPILKVIDSLSWSEETCVITKSKVDKISDSDGSTYRVNIQFSYRFDQEEFSRGRYNFSNISSSGRSGKAKVVDAHPVGSQHLCWVNTKDPHEAVISRAIPLVVYFIIPFSSVFILIGGVLIGGALNILPERRKPIRNFQDEEETNLGSSPEKSAALSNASQGEKMLKPQTGRVTKVFASLFIACFWNGIVGIFVFQAFKGGDILSGLSLFMIPFILIGLVLIAGVFHSIMALANPRFELVVSEASSCLGETIELRCTGIGSLSKLKNLKIELEGEEAATYRRGTNSVTDRCIFHRQTILDSSQPMLDGHSKNEFTIPANSMHSFVGGSNKIEWRITLKGTIKMWPDVSNQYSLTVRSHSSNQA